MVTDFSAMDYQALWSMSRQLDGARISSAGRRLVESAVMLRDATLALYLKREAVVWSGPAADQFGSWTQSLTNSTFQLADFVHNQGTRLVDLGGTVTEAVARIPEVSAEVLNQHAAVVANAGTAMALDPVGTSDFLAKTDKVIADAQTEAAAQMRIVAQSYEGTTHVMKLEPRPEFYPPANVIDIRENLEVQDVGSGAGARVGSSVAGVASQTSLAGAAPGRSPAYAGGTVTPNSNAWPVSSVPGSSSSATAATPPIGSNLVQDAAIRSPDPQTTPETVLTAVPRPTANGPAVQAHSPSVDHVAGDGSLGASGPGLVAGTVPPGSRNAPGVTAKSTSATPPSRAGSSLRRPEGIVGGTPRPGQGPHEGRVGGVRTGMPMTGGVGGPAPTTGGATAARTATGRPLGGVPGGVVGGPPASGRPGARREFTTGGSGLRPRDAASAPPGQSAGGTSHGRPAGGMYGGAAAAPPAGERGRRERADYLTEDDEYWNGRRNDGVPPVIG